jgi:hypothetical protein
VLSVPDTVVAPAVFVVAVFFESGIISHARRPVRGGGEKASCGSPQKEEGAVPEEEEDEDDAIDDDDDDDDDEEKDTPVAGTSSPPYPRIPCSWGPWLLPPPPPSFPK